MKTWSTPPRASTQSAVRTTLGQALLNRLRENAPSLAPLRSCESRARHLGAPFPREVVVTRQPAARLGRILRMNKREVACADVRQRIKGQPVPHRRIAGQQEHGVRAEEPGSALPVRPVTPRHASQRQSKPHDARQPLLELPRQPLALLRVLELALERIDVDRKLPLPPQIIHAVLVPRQAPRRVDLQPFGEPGHDAPGGFRASRVRLLRRHRRGEQGVWPLPERLAVGAPMAREGPARQLLARIPLALSVMQQGRVEGSGAARRRKGAVGVGRGLLVGPSASVFHSGPSGSAAATKVGSPPMVSRTSWAARSRSTRSPSATRRCHAASPRKVWRDALRLGDTADIHVVAHHRFAVLGRAGDRGGGALRLGRAGEQNVRPSPGEQARGRIRGRPSPRPANTPRTRRAGR